MTFDGLRAGLRLMFWVLVYLGTFCGAVLAFARGGTLAPVAWAAVVTIIAHDAHHRFT